MYVLTHTHTTHACILKKTQTDMLPTVHTHATYDGKHQSCPFARDKTIHIHIQCTCAHAYMYLQWEATKASLCSG